MKYDDFVLRIATEGERTWLQARSPAGEAEARFRLPEDLAKALEGLVLREQPSPELGSGLFKALFPLPVRHLFDQSLARLGPSRGLRLRLALDPESPELHAIPWELLRHPETGDFLALSRRTPVVRALDFPASSQRPRKESLGRLRILAVASQPADFPALDLSGEVRVLADLARHRRHARVTALENPDPEALLAALRGQPFDVLHVMGHGGQNGILLARSDGSSITVTGDQLASILRGFDAIRLVVLNAGESAGVGLALVRAGIPAVLAMRTAMEDRLAVLFSEALYRRLHLGDPVAAALTEARQALRIAAPDSMAWAEPLLIEGFAGVVVEAPAARHRAGVGRALGEGFESRLAAARSLLRRHSAVLAGGKGTARPATTPRFDHLPAWLGVALGLAAGGGAAVALLQGPPVVAVAGFVLLLGLAGWMVGSAQPVEAAEVAVPVPAAPPAEAIVPAPAEPPSPAELAWQAPELVRDRELVPLPGAVFEMGSPADEDGHDSNESPLHEVRVSPFACMRYPVTRRLYEAVVGKDPGWPEGEADDRPVNNVSWEDAVRFCNRWSEREGLVPCYEIREDGSIERRGGGGYRLPTEAEWEYACRAGTRTRWSFGDEEAALDRHAWYKGNSGGEPQPVGRKEPNRWGLHDLHGNVWEWVEDWYGPYSAEPQEDPAGPTTGDSRVLRGGSFIDAPWVLRSAFRLRFVPTFRNGGFGFRCVRAAGREP